MTMIAPGVYTTVTTAPPSPNSNVATGTWFVTGITAQGPVGVPIPITSIADYTNYLGARTSAQDSYNITYNLYDALDEYFHDGGVLAYVSRVVGPAAGTAQISLVDVSNNTSMTVKAAGPGAWGNSLNIVVVQGANSSYTIQVQNAGTVVATSPNLYSAVDAQNWFNAQNSWAVQILVTAGSGGIPVAGTFALGGGSDDNSHITDTSSNGWTQALTAFTDSYGPGQVSAPGHSTTAGWVALTAHAQSFNRVAFLDVLDSSSASALEGQVSTFQSNTTVKHSYSAVFGPWVIIPGLTNTNPGASSPVPNRVVPPSSLAAALVASSDQTNDCNVPAAGPAGQSIYAIGVTQTYNLSDRGALNSAGICVIRNFQGAVTQYGFRTPSLDPTWTYLNNTRFRMQMIYDFDNIGEGFVFNEIDGQGHLFSTFNGALAGKCAQYWTNGSLYGSTAQQAYAVNTSSQVNTPATIAAGQINAIVSVKMSPFAEVVNISVVKYLSSATIPS